MESLSESIMAVLSAFRNCRSPVDKAQERTDRKPFRIYDATVKCNLQHLAKGTGTMKM